jgi:heat shock transcription factor, other eukaryote
MGEAAAAVAASKRGGGPAPFLTKTHQMVEERGTDEVISWAEQGRSFVVWKPVELARDLLPLHFKHCNFSSFVRQLNTYVSTLRRRSGHHLFYYDRCTNHDLYNISPVVVVE